MQTIVGLCVYKISQRPAGARLGLSRIFNMVTLPVAASGLGQGGLIILIASNVRIRLGRIEASFILLSTLSDIL